jgi:hypothetical protein
MATKHETDTKPYYCRKVELRCCFIGQDTDVYIKQACMDIACTHSKAMS